MKTNEFTWTDPLGKDHKLRLDFGISFTYTQAHVEFSDELIADGQAKHLYNFCNEIARDMFDLAWDDEDKRAEIECGRTDFEDDDDIMDFWCEVRILEIQHSIRVLVEIEIHKQYTDLANDIAVYNGIISLSQRALMDKYNR